MNASCPAPTNADSKSIRSPYTVLPCPRGNRWEWVKYQLRLRGYSLAEIGRENGCSENVAKIVRIKPYPKMEAAIAAKLDMHPAEIWPERYGPDGKSNRKSGNPEWSKRRLVGK